MKNGPWNPSCFLRVSKMFCIVKGPNLLKRRKTEFSKLAQLAIGYRGPAVRLCYHFFDPSYHWSDNGSIQKSQTVMLNFLFQLWCQFWCKFAIGYRGPKIRSGHHRLWSRGSDSCFRWGSGCKIPLYFDPRIRKLNDSCFRCDSSCKIRLDSDPGEPTRIPVRQISLGFLNPVIRYILIGSLWNRMTFNRNPMGSDRFLLDPIVGLMDLGRFAQQAFL